MKRSLGPLLALGFAGIQFLAVMLVVFSSYLSSEAALVGHARKILRDVGTNTIEHSRSFLSPARGAAVLAARLAQNEVVASDDPSELEKLLFQQLQLVPQVSGIFFGTEEGEFYYVMRDEKTGLIRSKLVTFPEGARRTELIWRDTDFSIDSQSLDPQDNYDPRVRPWYQQTQAEMRSVWTDPYIFFTSQRPGITLAAPVTNPDGSLLGVMGVDIEISSISDFLSRLKIGRRGQALIINENGDVIAHPDKSLIKTGNADGTYRFATIGELGDPIARAAFGPLFEAGAPPGRATRSDFQYGDETYVAQVMPVGNDIMPWTIAVYAPKSDFTAEIEQNRAVNIWIAAALAIATGLVGLILANLVYRPVRAFAVRSALVAQGELDPSEPLPRTYGELERANDALVQEIAERRKVEQEYGQTFEMASRGMAQITADDGRFLRVNKQFCELTGYSAAELLEMRATDLAMPSDPTGIAQARDLSKFNLPLHTELCCRRKDGEPVWLQVNGIVVRDQAGTALHIVLSVEDMTRARDQDHQIQTLNRELAHLARTTTMSQLAAGLAHELNQPLASIAQNVDSAMLTVAQMGTENKDLQLILSEIEEQAIRAGEIIRALRGFIGRDEGGRSAFDVALLVEQSWRLVNAEAAEIGARIETELEGLPLVEANRVQVAQVLVNLLHNSIEAMATDADSGAPLIRVGASLSDKMVTVYVEDSGPGLDPTIRLFSDFETTKPTGMGLGLSISRSLVEANGGKIWHDSSCASGARFCFTLPVHGTHGEKNDV
ncbi:cache domain-containing protein [Tropicimonas sp. TH_r6]|uniref:cache domain-containing protein n=1 Tax=Tropicimonas sp. TH_r6 TaxID=3082085 RepID=UPI002952C830|nr:cache domain-containing protein [Tropicimonas sp. TH_r6]MDV7141076.1 cache domain-containing protein [Tropicimonas sp. TH_r6]